MEACAAAARRSELCCLSARYQSKHPNWYNLQVNDTGALMAKIDTVRLAAAAQTRNNTNDDMQIAGNQKAAMVYAHRPTKAKLDELGIVD